MLHAEKLTIIMVLKDRTPFTWRWMDYYNKVGLPCKVLIADGGKDSSVEKLRDTSLFPNINYEYIRYPYDKDIPTFLNKLQSVTERVTTKYAILVDNDDIHLVEPLGEAVEFLEQHDDYMAARGEVFDFRILSSDKSSDAYGKMTAVSKVLYCDSNTEDTALARVREFSEFSTDIAHDVCRAKELTHVCGILAESKITDLQLSDHLMDYLLSACGKIHRGEGIYMFHQSHFGGLGRKLLNTDPFEWMMAEHWANDFHETCATIAQEICDRDKTPFQETLNKVMQYYICFIIGKNVIGVRRDRKLAKPTLIVRLGRILPKNNPIRSYFKEVYSRIRERYLKYKSDKFIRLSPYQGEIESMREFLEKNSFIK